VSTFVATGTAAPTLDDIPGAVSRAVAWLNARNGTGREEIGLRVLKVAEEAGEAAAAWIGYVGQNPRKGATHTTEEVAAELADVAFTALVAIASVGHDPARTLADCLAKVSRRITADTNPGQAA